LTNKQKSLRLWQRIQAGGYITGLYLSKYKEKNMANIGEARHDCFACEEATDLCGSLERRCDFCPIDWCDDDKEGCCEDSESPYNDLLEFLWRCNTKNTDFAGDIWGMSTDERQVIFNDLVQAIIDKHEGWVD